MLILICIKQLPLRLWLFLLSNTVCNGPLCPVSQDSSTRRVPGPFNCGPEQRAEGRGARGRHVRPPAQLRRGVGLLRTRTGLLAGPQDFHPLGDPIQPLRLSPPLAKQRQSKKYATLPAPGPIQPMNQPDLSKPSQPEPECNIYSICNTFAFGVQECVSARTSVNWKTDCTVTHLARVNARQWACALSRWAHQWKWVKGKSMF